MAFSSARLPGNFVLSIVIFGYMEQCWGRGVMVARSEWDWGRYQEGVGIKSGFPISYFTYLFNGVMARKNMKTNKHSTCCLESGVFPSLGAW